MNKRGQAAMEFLMTYGWAILAAIIAIGVLAYFGVFSPGKYGVLTALVTAPFYANAWNVNTTDVNIELRNNGPQTLTIQSVELSNINGATSCNPVTLIGDITSGNTAVISIPCTDLIGGDTFKADITIKYTKSGSTLEQISTGTITDRVVLT